MNLQTWSQAVTQRLTPILHTIGQMTPTMIYGALAGATAFPLVEALQQATAQNNIAAMMTIGGFAGQLGGNVLVDLLNQWRQRSETDLCANLAQEVQRDEQLRHLFDTLFEKAEIARVVQTVLGQADKDDLKQLTESLNAVQQALTHMGSRVTVTVGGDQVLRDKFGGDQVGRDKIETQVNHNYALSADPKPDLRQRYLKRLRQTCSSLPLFMLGGDDERGSKVTLDNIYIELNTTTTEPVVDTEKEESKKQNQMVREDERRPVSALEIATRNQRLVLLGAPGSGKSTFVQKLAGWLAAAELDATVELPTGWQRNLLPIVTVLRDLAPRLSQLDLAGLRDEVRDKRLRQALLEHWRAELMEGNCADFIPTFEDALRDGLVFLVFDGLDEVPQQSRNLVRATVHSLLHEYQQIERVIITCRVRSYTGNAIFAGWADHRLAPFTDEQIQQFIVAWYNTQFELGQIRSEQERRSQIEDLQRAAQGEALRELAENPMLLTTMALIHQREVRLPTQRVKLYQLAVDNLLQRWQRRKSSVSERLERVLHDERRLRKIVERIAYQSLHVRTLAEEQQAKQNTRQNERETNNPDDDHSGDLQRGELLVLLEDPLYLPENGLPDEFLDYIDQRTGLLIGRGGDDSQDAARRERKPLSYRFPHRTFQEYLAGCYLVSQHDVPQEYWNHAAQGDGWELAALLGGEELYFNSKNGANTLLETLYLLCGRNAPRNSVEWRRVFWSAQLAALFDRVEIERHSRGAETGIDYLKRITDRLLGAIDAKPKRLTERLLSAIEMKSKLSIADRAIAGSVLGKLGDPRQGVGVIKQGTRAWPDIDWIEIPAGPFIMGGEKNWEGGQKFTCTLIDKPYRISRYPITVAQYAEFIKADGYQKQEYWTKAGWDWRNENQIDAPRSFGRNFETPNHPQVGVSWYEAVAYCRFLTALCKDMKAGNTGIICLPTEAQWERAARHDDGRIYPWGDKWDEKRCNNNYLNLSSTSAVGLFPNGNAVCGAADMSGNVWEWCSTDWLENYIDYQTRVNDDLENCKAGVVRGGSWYNLVNYVRCAYRYRLAPGGRFNILGFRLVSPGC